MSPRTREIRVGLVILVALGVLAVGIFLIGDKNNLFSRKNLYYVDFNSVSGLKPGSPVQLDGVDVGTIQRVVLPESPWRKDIRVWLEIDQHYSGRIRSPEKPRAIVPGEVPTRARIKTLGLLGDKFIELTSGSPSYPVIRPWNEEDKTAGHIPAAQPTNVDALIASGEDVMDNVVQISHSLNSILNRMERGEGLLGQLTHNTPQSKRLQESLIGTSESLERIALTIENGKGPLPRLLNDPAMATQLSRSLDRFESILAKAETGEGLLPGLLNDPSTRTQFDETLASLQGVAQDLQEFTADLETSDALLPRLVKDEEYGRQVAEQVRQFVTRLNEVSYKVSEGQGTASKLINDPQIYEAVNDIIIGVNESRMLRWLLRNRQKKGIETRYNVTKDAIEKSGGTAPPLDRDPETVEEPPPVPLAGEEPLPPASGSSDPTEPPPPTKGN